MASFVRKIMRGIVRGNRKQMTANGAAFGSHRAGMHQAAEHEYQRGRMAEAVPPEPKTVEDALDMPAAVEAEIPPVEEEDDQIVEDIAEGEGTVEAEPEILEEISDPQAEIEEETAGITEEEATLAVDYSTERIPVLDYQVTGSVDPSTPLEYTSQDGSVKEIQEPLPGMQEAYGIAPYIPGMEDPSANVAEDFEPEPDPEPDPEPVVPEE